MWLYIACFVLIGVAVLMFIIRIVIRTTVYYDNIPDLHGKTIVVTGASSGLGLRLTETLVKHGARVITINRYLDDINFVQHFASEIAKAEDRIDCLVNNADKIHGKEFTLADFAPGQLKSSVNSVDRHSRLRSHQFGNIYVLNFHPQH
ncbi:short-chain dehydrogenase TIC 32 [Tropilaelaps mercedesae]|uniref:Short-chain dehydrogenase TIC 32 n=1 Tax=Tropilaelaps mercedesae TaxID=418985 RepID=A0A1V9XNU2_9ACAR|nr:short-chain dehydrogenase TIC 32 [Tropilaelaps mercedesae]